MSTVTNANSGPTNKDIKTDTKIEQNESNQEIESKGNGNFLKKKLGSILKIGLWLKGIHILNSTKV